MAAKPPMGLELLVDEKRVNDLLTQKSGAKAACRSVCKLLLFVTFIALFTLLALVEPLGAHRAFEGYVRRRFDSHAAMPLREVESAYSFWQYTDRSLIPGIYGNDTQKYSVPGYVVPKLLQIEGANKLFGIARLRMLKVKKDMDCQIPDSFQRAFSVCYGPYAVEAEDKAGFGPTASNGDTEFTYALGDSEATGKVATYGTGGFMEALTSTYQATFDRLGFLKSKDWIGPASRVVIYEFTVYNFNLGMYAVCRIMFEVTPVGQWVKTFDVTILEQRHLSALGFGTSTDWFALVGEAILVLFVLGYLMEEASEFLGCEHRAQGKFPSRRPTIKLEYFSDAWNLLDWANLLLIITTLGIRVSTWTKASPLQVYIGDPADAGLDTFTDLNGVVSNVRFMRGLIAFNTVLTWFKAVKYINIIPYIKLFMQTVAMSQKMLFSSYFVFFTMFASFILAYYVAFGESTSIFSTPWKAFVFLLRTFLGDGDMSIVYDAAPLLGSVLIIFWVLGMFFLVINLFNGILIGAFSDAKQKEDAKNYKKWNQTMDRIKEFLDWAWERGRLETQLRASLPGLYSRWMRRKKKQEQKEKERDEMVVSKQRARVPDQLQALGPGNPSFGTREKRPQASISLQDEDSDDGGSEPDLGPLRSKDQLMREDDIDVDIDKVGGAATGLPSNTDEPQGEPSPEAIDLVIDATRHVAQGIVQRTHAARFVLFGEMAESKEVLQSVGSVLEVLSRRARDLEAQQVQLLKHF